MREAVQPVAVGDDDSAFHLVQHLAHLLRRVLAMIQERNEAGDGALKIDVVFPQRVVGVDEQRLRAV